MISWFLDQCESWNFWLKSVKSHFLVKEAEIVSLRLEHLSETHFL